VLCLWELFLRLLLIEGAFLGDGVIQDGFFPHFSISIDVLIATVVVERTANCYRPVSLNEDVWNSRGGESARGGEGNDEVRV
jgi:hypothetical protein